CQMSTSASATGLPCSSRIQAVTNTGSPGVGERTMEPPCGVSGEPLRQNGPIRLAVVSPPCALFCRQTSAETPSDPAASTTSLCDGVVSWPAFAISPQICRNSASVSCVSCTNACRCCTAEASSVRRRASGVRSTSARTARVRSLAFSMTMALFDMEAAVDHQRRAGDEGGFIRGEPEDGIRDLDRVGPATEKRGVLPLCLQFLDALAGGHRAVHVEVGERGAGPHHVDAHAVARLL